MKTFFYKYNFTIIKLLMCLNTVIYSISNKVKPFKSIELEWLLVAIFIFTTVSYELSEHRKIWLWCEIILTLVLYLTIHNTFMMTYCLIVVCLDTITYYKWSFTYSLACYCTLLINQDGRGTLFLCCSFLIAIYYQNYCVINEYQSYIADSAKEEYNLKENINIQKQITLKEKEKSLLYAENKILEERERLFQQLHDRLGHSINGSIYQLEASKVLIDKKTDDSKKIIQGVIDNLRRSMDEIRTLFRKEKPSKRKMSIVQLYSLCKECKEKYEIEAEFTLEGEENRIPENVMEVILDNIYEAVTNSLKYSGCDKIAIKIVVLNQFVRCQISDNGRGCEKIEEGMGIQGMKNRMRVINGILSIRSEIGFQIDMLFPLSLEKMNS